MPRKSSRARKLKPHAARSDQEIVEGIRRRNEADFNLLYERYFQRVYSFA